MKATVAVIMSVYRGDKPEQIARAVHSVLSQEQRLIEPPRIYLGVDGPVPAEISAVLTSLSAQIHRTVAFPENRGLAHVLNDLLDELGEEDFVFRMDSDDECFPDRFDRQVAYLQIHPDIDILGAAIVERHEDTPPRLVTYPADHRTLVSQLYWRGAFAHPTVCFRGTSLKKIGRYPIQALSEDLALWFHCAESGDVRFANLQEPLLYFTVNSNFWKRRGMMRAWRELIVWTKGNFRLYGLSWKVLVPTVRFGFRLVPSSLQRALYGSRLRVGKKVLGDGSMPEANRA